MPPRRDQPGRPPARRRLPRPRGMSGILSRWQSDLLLAGPTGCGRCLRFSSLAHKNSQTILNSISPAGRPPESVHALFPFARLVPALGPAVFPDLLRLLGRPRGAQPEQAADFFFELPRTTPAARTGDPLYVFQEDIAGVARSSGLMQIAKGVKPLILPFTARRQFPSSSRSTPSMSNVTSPRSSML